MTFTRSAVLEDTERRQVAALTFHPPSLPAAGSRTMWCMMGWADETARRSRRLRMVISLVVGSGHNLLLIWPSQTGRHCVCGDIDHLSG